jgi:hypothetical protein
LRAGAPAIVMFGSMNEAFATEFAPIAMLSAMTIGPYRTAPGPM